MELASNGSGLLFSVKTLSSYTNIHNTTETGSAMGVRSFGIILPIIVTKC